MSSTASLGGRGNGTTSVAALLGRRTIRNCRPIIDERPVKARPIWTCHTIIDGRPVKCWPTRAERPSHATIGRGRNAGTTTRSARSALGITICLLEGPGHTCSHCRHIETIGGHVTWAKSSVSKRIASAPHQNCDQYTTGFHPFTPMLVGPHLKQFMDRPLSAEILPFDSSACATLCRTVPDRAADHSDIATTRQAPVHPAGCGDGRGEGEPGR